MLKWVWIHQKKIGHQNRKMQIPYAKNNVFGVRHYFKEHSNKNDQNRQHQDLAGFQKYKKIAKNSFASCFAVMVVLYGINFAYFVNLSIIV